MKKITLICGLIASSITAGFAQDDDALTFAGRALKMSLDEPVLGTARYSGMAGAMGALGGDGGAIKDNPAALGIYRKWDIGLTPNLNLDNDGNADFNINNFSCVMNFGKKNRKHGYITSSFAIAYNRLANYNRDTYTTGTLEDGTYYENEFLEDDGSGLWHFAYGMNISNAIYAGIGINVASLSYKQSTESVIGRDFETNDFEVLANGWNLNLGVIAKPAKFLRVGAAFTTPTWLSVSENAYYPERDENNNLTGGVAGYEDAQYDVQTPLKVEGSLGFIMGKRAVADIDYIYSDASALRVKNANGHQFRDIKYFADKNYKATHTIKIGTEIQIAKGFAGRLGFAHQTAPTQDDCYGRNISRQPLYNNGLYVPYQYESVLYSYSIPKAANYITLGAGYHGKNFYADIAYVNKQQKEDFYEWQEPVLNASGEIDGWKIDPISQTIKTHNIMFTVGAKF